MINGLLLATNLLCPNTVITPDIAKEAPNIREELVAHVKTTLCNNTCPVSIIIDRVIASTGQINFSYTCKREEEEGTR